MKGIFVTPDSPSWSAVLADSVHDFYHLPEYARLCARQEGGVAFAFLAKENDNRFLLPLILRSIPITPGGDKGGQYCDVTCP